MSYPNRDPKDPKQFGPDLVAIFGPTHTRRHISTLSSAEKNEILSKIPEYVDTDDLGARPSLFQVANKILMVLQQSKALIGIDLDWCTSLTHGKLRRHKSCYVPVQKSYKNNSVQRGIKLRHLVKDILFCFDPTNVLMCLARTLSDGTSNINNGQHRIIACIILGIRDIPVEDILSDHEMIDVKEYATDNLYTLGSSEFDEYRILYRMFQVASIEGSTDQLPEKAIMCNNMFDIHHQIGSRFVEKQPDIGAKECTAVGNMMRHYENYGEEIYSRAVNIICTVFSKAPLTNGNVWPLMEFIRTQHQSKIDDPNSLDWTIQQCIMHKYSDPKIRGMHLDIKNEFTKFAEKNAGFDKCPIERYLAAGIYKMCKIVEPDHNWIPILWNGTDLSTCLDGFHVMPKQPILQNA